MSHFKVLVVGENIDEQLAPYHEFECSGKIDEYVLDVDVTEDIIKQMEGKTIDEENFLDALGYYGFDETCFVDSEDDVDRYSDKHKWGYVVITDKESPWNNFKAVNRTNPNKKWDWYQVGGRWSDMIKLKTGELTNSAKIGDIDFAGMYNDAAKEGEELYDSVYEATKHIDMTSWLTWKQVREKFSPSIDAARVFYNDQKFVQELSKVDVWLEADDFANVSKEDYVKSYALSNTVPFALVKDSNWYQKGDMGWFGMVSNESSEWHDKFNELMKDLTDNDTVTIVDCHI